MVRLFSVRENEPLWRNWQTHLTQNQAGNRAGSSPASGTYRSSLNGSGSFFLPLNNLQSKNAL